MAKKKFELDDKQTEKLNKWIKRHNSVCIYKKSGKEPAIGGRLTYRFTPTGVGVISQVFCLCGKKVDLTPDDW